jgi:hypothetical protein
MSAYGSMWPPPPSFSANLASQDVYANTQTTLTAIGSGSGSVGPNLSVSSLTVAGAIVPGGRGVGIVMDSRNPSVNQSARILFNGAGQDNVNSGQLMVCKSTWLGINSEQVAGFAVESFSTIYGSFQPLVAGDLYVNNSDGDGAGSGRITYVDSVSSMSLAAAGGNVSISSMQTSTINGIPFEYIISTLHGLSPGGFTPPSAAPTVPVVSGTPSSTSITVTFDVTGITGNPAPTYSIVWGTTTSPTTLASATLVSGTTYTATVSGLSAATAYYFASRASNASGTLTSATSAAINTAAGGAAPSGPPTPPAVLGDPTQTTIIVVFDTAGITGAPTPTYSVVWGTTTTPTTPAPATLISGTQYSATVGGLTANTTYYFASVASNSSGTQTSTPSAPITTAGAPPADGYVSTILAVGFFTYESNYILDTATNVDVGNWNPIDGTITYPATPAVTGPQYLSSIKGNGSKVVLSMGGGQANATVLSTMFGADDGISLAQSVNYAFFNGSSANPLSFNRTSWNGFAFDGIDLDIEAATPTRQSLLNFTSTLKQLNPSILVTAAPQSPYLTQGANSGLNANGGFTSFSEMNAATNLSAVYTGNAGAQESLLSPRYGNLIDYNFIQCYNNAAYSYPTGPTSSNWYNVVAAWGIQSLQTGNTKNIYAFATVDGAPIWDAVNDATAFNSSLTAANTLIQQFSTTTGVFPYASVTIDKWCAGIGFWASSSSPGGTSNSINALSISYTESSVSKMPNLPSVYCMTYAGVYQNNSWGWNNTNTPVPNARGF